MQIVDIVAHSDGRFTALADDGSLRDLVYGDTATRRIWRSVETPFKPTKLAIRSDGSTFVIAADGALWQRLPDDRSGASQWRQIAKAPA
jgi:hypothetical protein